MLSNALLPLLPLLLTTTATLVLAAPTTRTASTTLSTSKTITFIANVLSADLTPPIQSHALAPLPTSTDRCANALGLSPSPSGGGALFHGDNSTVFTVASGAGFAERLGLSVVSGGSATVPAARAVGVECGNAGTDGVRVVQKDDGTPVLRFGTREGSGWMACPAAVLHADVVPADDGAVVVGFREGGQRILAGCAEVEFVAVCSGETDGGEPSAVEVPCVVSG